MIDAYELLSRTTPLAAILDASLFGEPAAPELERMRADSPTTKFFCLADGEERARLSGLQIDGVYGRADTKALIQELYRLAMA
jgi:hypothetical protein